MTMNKTVRAGLAGSTLALTLGIGSLADADDLSGRYVQVQHRTLSVQVPVIGAFDMTTRVVSIHDVEHRGSRLRGGGTLCAVDIDNATKLVTTVLPKALQRVLPPPTIDARLIEVDGELRLVSSKQTIVVGADLDDEQRDDLPLSSRDERVVDDDGDGKPGVTVRIDGMVSGDMYVVQRTWTKLIGTQKGDGFRGRLVFGTDQVVLGATSSRLEDPPKAKPLATKSTFTLQPIAANMSCKDAVELTKGWTR